MFGLVVMEGMTLSGHLSNINEINEITNLTVQEVYNQKSFVHSK
jgi:hypothetical protein